jgi:alpha-mannosidase
MEGYAFTRPGGAQIPLAKPAFWWEGAGGGRVLAYRPAVGWYGSERAEMPQRLDDYLAAAREHRLENVGVFFGVGNHGGGPTRRQIADIRAWAQAHTDEVRLVPSGLHRLFDALRTETAANGDDLLPTHRGELNFVLRGCYASVAKFKFLYRKAEAALDRAERTATVISATANAAGPAVNGGPAWRVAPAGSDEPGSGPIPSSGSESRLAEGHAATSFTAWAGAAGTLGDAWDALLFNSFHDILPGSSIERAYDDQIAQVGGALHQAQRAELAALNALARRVDTYVAPSGEDRPSPIAFLVWNPHPQPYRGHVELEGCLDYRPIWEYQGRPNALPVVLRGPDGDPVSFQHVATEHLFAPNLPWRTRALLPVELPPLGWTVYTLGWEEGVAAPKVEPGAFGVEPNAVSNNALDLWADVGTGAIHLLRGGELVFGEAGMSLVTVTDPWGAWGGMGEEPESLSLSKVLHRWKVEKTAILESGPERATLWVRLTGGDSWAEFTFHIYRDREDVEVAARILWNERAARLKMVFPVGANSAEFDVPGGAVTRHAPTGEVPGGRWVRAGSFGFASDALYDFELSGDGSFRATICRASRYAAEQPEGPEAAPWNPAVDAGELRFRFTLAPADQIARRAQELELPPVAVLVPPSPGDLARTGSLATITPESMCLLALKPAEDSNGTILRAQNMSDAPAEPMLTWQNKPIRLGLVGAGHIATWRITHDEIGSWVAESTDLQERRKG